MSIVSPISKLDNWFTGEDQDLIWTVYQSDDQTVQDIGGWTIQFRMAPTASGVSVLSKTAVLDDPELGVCRVTVDRSDTQSFTPKKYHYTLSRTDTGENQVLAHGPAWLQARVG